MRDRAFLLWLAAAIVIPFLIVLAPIAAPALSDPPSVHRGTISTAEAGSYVGSYKTVEGLAEDVHVARSGSATFIDLDGQYPLQPFTAVIFDQSRVGDVSDLEGRIIDVSGTIRFYHDHPEIIVESRSQIVARR
ncbi:MAG: hypothetical protein ACTHLR_04215 [Rhizomicrobium sp.]